MTAEQVPIGFAAMVLGVSTDTIRRYLDNGTLDGCRLPSGHRRITRESLDRVKAERVRP